MTRPTIRPAVPDDAHGITVVHVRGWQSAYRGLFSDELLDGLDIEEATPRRRGWLEAPRDPANASWVIEDDDGISGFAMTGPTPDTDLDTTSLELYAIYVLPERIGSGLGRALMDHVIADLAARCFAEIVLWVLCDNTGSVRFYEHAGFIPDERVRPVTHGETGLLKQRMRRPI